MAYAYYDKHGILHVVDHLGLAVEHCKGIVVETDIACEGGYPVVGGKQIIFDNSQAKCFVYGENSQKVEMTIPEEVEALINKIFMNEYSIASEDDKRKGMGKGTIENK
jgi:hypothetical protein